MPVALAAIPAISGIFQAINGRQQAKDAQEQLSKLQTPPPNQSILDYYNTALQKYNTSPYQSALYKNAQNLIGRNVATGITAAQQTGHGQGVVPNLVQGANDASQKAADQANQLQRQDFATLGHATQMRGQTESQAANQAFQKQYGLQQARAIGGNQIENAGLQNIWGGISGLGKGIGALQSQDTSFGTKSNIWGQRVTPDGMTKPQLSNWLDKNFMGV